VHKQNKNNGKSVGLMCGLLGVSLLVGCSSPLERKQANKDFDYQDVKLVTRPFVVPTGLHVPEDKSDYKIPALSPVAQKGVLAGDVDVRAPIQVLTVVPGSRAEVDGSNVTLWFTARSVNQRVDNDIWNQLLAFMGRRSIGIADLNIQARTMDTDWFYATESLTPWTEQAKDDEQMQVHQRYRFTIKSDIERHRTGLMVQLLSHEAFVDGDKDDTPVSSFEGRRYAGLLLNQLALDYDRQLRIGEVSKSNGRAAMSLGVDDNGLTAWLVDAPFEATWSRLITLLPKLNFEITSKPESKGLIVVDYDEPDADFWKQHDIEPFGLDSGTYRLQLGEYKGKTSITLFDEDKKPVPTSVVSKMFIGLSKAFGREQAGVMTK
jgi:outer membrane protein assembly factor BamC